MPLSLSDTLRLTPQGEALTAHLSGDYSNGRIDQPPEAGFPFGGLLAALCAQAMRQGLGLTAPLRTLSVQYLSAARFDDTLAFRPRLLRGGRTVGYAAVETHQDGRLTHNASATFGGDAEGQVRAELAAAIPPLNSLDPAATIAGPMAPRFSQHVEYRFDGGPNILGGNAEKPAVERLWMRMADARPLDDLGLCYLLDALYPPAWTTTRRPSPMTTVDLRYDILADPTPQTAPDGWAFFEFRLLDLGLGWTVDDVTCWGADGAPLALGRQRRKLIPPRRAAQSA